MEIELKLLISPEHVEKLRKHPLLEKHAVKNPRVQELVSTYFDTPTFEIRRCNAALRVRQVNGDNWIQTLKGGGKVEAGLHQNNEWECRVESAAPDLAALRDLVEPGTQWYALLQTPALSERLLPMFTSRVNRTVWKLALKEEGGDDNAAGSTEIEFALDEGVLERNDVKLPISEVELELKAGSPQQLFEFALKLLDDVPMRIGNQSKAERGYGLCMPRQRAAVKAAKLILSKDMTVEQGLQAIIGNCLSQIQENETGVVQTHDPESVHQMRVGMRRLRSALGIFKALAPCPPALLDEIKWTANQLGAARDWEVLSGSTLVPVARAASNDEGMTALQQAALQLAQERRDAAASVVESVRYTKWMLAFSTWAQGANWNDRRDDSSGKSSHGDMNAPLQKFARKTIAHHHRKLLKRGKGLDTAPAEARHEVRIVAKKTRYATEFFQSLFPSGQVRHYVDALSALQDELGWMNDAAVADGLLRELQEKQPESAASAGFARGYLLARTENESRQLHKLWKRFAAMKPPSGK